MIHVVRGRVIYHVCESQEVHHLTSARPGVVEPEVLHFVEVTAGTEFFVEFWK